ncbi:hypothetical protein C9J85_08940 [Haloferax sp. wsp5]|nr:hypothetical protein C9J85_08940 [Haloferax sp. wsp5]
MHSEHISRSSSWTDAVGVLERLACTATASSDLRRPARPGCSRHAGQACRSGARRRDAAGRRGTFAGMVLTAGSLPAATDAAPPR